MFNIIKTTAQLTTIALLMLGLTLFLGTTSIFKKSLDTHVDCLK